MLDWIFEAIIDWVARTVTSVMDAVSGIFLNALGTDMLAMEEYFPFVTRAFTIMQYTAWALLFIILVWQLFKTFGGPITEAEEPWGLVLRSSLFAILIYFAKPIFLYVLDIARAPYTALMDVAMTGEDFSFAGVEAVLKNGLVQYVSNMSVVGAILQIILIMDDVRCGSTEKYPTSILTFPKAHPSCAEHPTEKPVALLEYLINTYTDEDDLVLDNCMGSGSTIVACIRTNRRYIGFELSEEHYATAERRIYNEMKERR